ncbi:glycosyltransferase [Fadolivirus algeromassiliense]|jgi:mannosyltransferase OCH1-like enzyme|uniref:Glycosyltransferase n=1 Tax=Fadolivirus FV1/VV64 TaxID=3070911 RepID=A0A7D3UW82_9VIRU|nr:glycosyltransferase [Fadolivirus algeromassiliense]QKF94629.1 glycosyltransferase [Fadolivirus FV1/VV64]
MDSFDWKIYRELNQDLMNAGFNTEKLIMDHWNKHGKYENRKTKVTDLTNDFNWKTYLELNSDLLKIGIINKTDVEIHWIRHGIKEGRKYKNNDNTTKSSDNTTKSSDNTTKSSDNTTKFNWKIYKDINIDLRRQGLKSEDEYTNHYKENINNKTRIKYIYDLYNDFNHLKYLEYNKNLKDNNIVNKNDLEEHWILHGRKEGFLYKEQSKSLSFHVLISTIGRMTLVHTLKSLVNQLTVSDYLTIVYDGKENTGNIKYIEKLVQKFKCKVKILVEPNNLGYWGHSIRNKYNILDGDFVMHGDDDDFYPADIFDKLRKICNNTDFIYIFKFEGHTSEIYSEEYTHGTIGTPSGVIPTKYNNQSNWGLVYGGDCMFYQGLESKFGNRFIFIPEYIYIVNITSKLIWNWEIYKLLNPSLNLQNENECVNHWKSIGYKSGLPFRTTDIFPDFKWQDNLNDNMRDKLEIEKDWLEKHSFNWVIYKELNSDLSNLQSDIEVIAHWYNVGYNENRKYKITDQISDFDWLMYKKFNPDLEKAGLTSKFDIELHWLRHGSKEGRNYKKGINTILPIQNNEPIIYFNWKIYKEMNPDLEKNGFKTENQLINHWNTYGKNEKRICCVTDITPDFDYDKYKFFNEDLEKNGIKSRIDIEYHWIKYGMKENRIYKSTTSESTRDTKTNDLISSVKTVNNYNWKIYREINIPLRRNNLVTDKQYIKHLNDNNKDNSIYRTIYDIYHDFNSNEYLLRNNDLIQKNITTKEDLEEHWMIKGRKEGRIYKDDQKIKRSFHVIITTNGSKKIYHLLRSLINQLYSNDYITIIYDGKDTRETLDKVELILKFFKGSYKIIIEPKSLGFNRLRNKHINLVGDYVMYVEDEGLYYDYAFDMIRKICNDINHIYIFGIEDATGLVFSPKLIKGKIKVASGIIPLKYNNVEWGDSNDGDYIFYSNLENKYMTKIIFIPECIYTTNCLSTKIWNWEIYRELHPKLKSSLVSEKNYVDRWQNIDYNNGVSFRVTDIDHKYNWKHYCKNENDNKLTIDLLYLSHININDRLLHDNEIEDDIDWMLYRELNKDLIGLKLNTDEQLKSHWENHGKYESRMTKIIQLTPDFHWKEYLELNNDLVKCNIATKQDVEVHWIKYGIKEGRIYKKNDILIYNNGNKLTTYSENDDYDKYFNEYDMLCRIWYNKNFKQIYKYAHLLKLRNSKLPKIFHFIWIGPNKIPAKYIDYIKSWITNHNNYIFCIWTDYNIPELINSYEYKNAKKYAMKADILRYELLYIFGGIYVDCDFLCFKNIHDEIKNLEGFSAWESSEYIAIGLMGFKPSHKFIYDVINLIPYNFKNMINEINISKITGPIMFTRLFKENKYSNVKIFPQEFCYSYTYSECHSGKPYLIKPEYYAIHMWGHSWGKENNEIVNNQTNINFIQKLVQDNIINYNLDNIGPLDFDINKENLVSMIPKKCESITIFYGFSTEILVEYLMNLNKYINVKLVKYETFEDIEKIKDEDNVCLCIVNYTSNVHKMINKFFSTKNNCIILNLEQTTRKDLIEYYSDIHKYTDTVIDYSNENMEYLYNEYNFESFQIPYQYNEDEISKLKKFLDVKKEYDVVFCGWIDNKCSRRNNILNKLSSIGINVKIVSGWGDNRDKDIAKGKILLNLHYNDDYNIYESIRCDRWVFSGHLVISDDSLNINKLDINKLIIFEKYENLVDKVIDVLKNYEFYCKVQNEKLQESICDIRYNRYKCLLNTIDKIKILDNTKYNNNLVIITHFNNNNNDFDEKIFKLKSISNIIPNCDIVFCEHISYNNLNLEYITKISNHIKYFNFDFNMDYDVIKSNEIIYETKLFIYGLDKIKQFSRYNNIFKISYNYNFTNIIYDQLDNNNNCFILNKNNISNSIYKIINNDIDLFKKSIIHHLSKINTKDINISEFDNIIKTTLSHNIKIIT